MTDSKLTMLAAKAMYGEFAQQMIEYGFSPLADDRDAMRMAVKLGMKLILPKYEGDHTTAESKDGSVSWTADREESMQQTRDAIVCLAAELGRRMP